jgi:hypothetical protein
LQPRKATVSTQGYRPKEANIDPVEREEESMQGL